MQESSNIPPKTKKTLDLLNKYGFVWDYNGCYVRREKFSRALVTRLNVNGKYGIYDIHLSKEKNKYSHNYTLEFYCEKILLFRVTYLSNLEKLLRTCMHFSEVLNKVKNRKIIATKYFLDTGKKFTVLSCENNVHLIFLREKNQYRYYDHKYKFLEEVQTENLKSSINRIKLIDRL